MHQTGHSRAQSMQTVQFASSSAMTPRERGGSSGATSGYCWVCERRVIVLRVTASPFASPSPGTLMLPARCARPCVTSCPLAARHASTPRHLLEYGDRGELDRARKDL